MAIESRCIGQESCEACPYYLDDCDSTSEKLYKDKIIKIQRIDWIKISQDDRSIRRIANELLINEKTIRRHLKKRGLDKVPSKDSEEGRLRKSEVAKKGKDHPKWKGKNVSYHRLHFWIKKHKPKPVLCEICKKRSPYDLANVSGKYKRDIKDFKWLCRGCHMENDGRINNLLKGNPNEIRDNKGRFCKSCDGKEE